MFGSGVYLDRVDFSPGLAVDRPNFLTDVSNLWTGSFAGTDRYYGGSVDRGDSIASDRSFCASWNVRYGIDFYR